MGFQLHAATIKGPGHLVDNSPNQDAFLVRNWKTSWLAVVSDGMGSRKHSDVGSRLACEAVLETARTNNFDVSDRMFINSLYQLWLKKLGELSPNDAVATCIIAWGLANGKTRVFQLGDGMIIYSGIESGVIVQQKENSF
jgi:serine/threonine protein phosphatase PrpC